jgi:thiamine-monophosphate kinase
MATKSQRVPISQLTGENRIIRLLQNYFRDTSPLLKKGIGDDAAVIHPPHAQEYWIITTDMLLENVDFRPDWITPGQLGYKSISVNLSDLAAMGARPRFCTVSLGLPAGFAEDWILQFYRGLNEAGRLHDMLLIGGDLSRSEGGITISITALGESLNRKVLYRSGARTGHLLFVTGVLGRSAAGLKLLQDGSFRTRSRTKQEAIRSHLKPEARCRVGIWLAQCGLVSCMMDLSDGLSMDLPRICAANGVGAEIDASRLPIFEKSSLWGCDPHALALDGGEDYELLFAVPPAKADMLERNYPEEFPPISNIGKLTKNAGAIWISEAGRNRRRLFEGGYNHFNEYE